MVAILWLHILIVDNNWWWTIHPYCISVWLLIDFHSQKSEIFSKFTHCAESSLNFSTSTDNSVLISFCVLKWSSETKMTLKSILKVASMQKLKLHFLNEHSTDVGCTDAFMYEWTIKGPFFQGTIKFLHHFSLR